MMSELVSHVKHCVVQGAMSTVYDVKLCVVQGAMSTVYDVRAGVPV